MLPEADREKLDACKVALEVAADLDALARIIPAARADLRSQLRRASASVLLNVAEGASEFSPDEKARFYRMSRRSAAECMAILELLAKIGRVTPPMADAKVKLIRVFSMLSRPIQAVSPSIPVGARPVSLSVSPPGSGAGAARPESSNNVP